MTKKIILTTFCLISAIFGKSNYLPPLQPLENKISEPVRQFLEKNGEAKKIVTASTNSRDVLGRKTSSNNQPKNYVILPEETLEVDVAYLTESKPEKTHFGRFEEKNGIPYYWFNGVQVSEEDFIKKTESSLDTTYHELGFRAKLTATEIRNLISGPRKVFIQEAYKIVEDNSVDYNVIFNLSNVNNAHDSLYKGYGVGIYFDEYGCPEPHNYNSNFYQQGNCSLGYLFHPTGVVTTLQKTAPEATVYGFDSYNTIPNPFAFAPWISIGSHSWGHNTDSIYSPTDANFDNDVYNHHVAHFFAAGNQNFYNGDKSVTAPATAFNVIAVGAVNPSNGYYANYSRWGNSPMGNQKPEVGNYAEFIFSDVFLFTDEKNRRWTGEFTQTSAATPYTAAVSAIMMDKLPILKWHPEILKALFLASEKIPIGNASSYDQDNTTVAAKAISTFSSMSKARLNYWVGNNTCCFNSNNNITFSETGIHSHTHYRVAISWLTSGTYIAQNHCVSQDIDLRIYQNGQLIAYSISSENPFEVVDFTTTSNADLTIEIKRYANAGNDNVLLGYSFWEDN